MPLTKIIFVKKRFLQKSRFFTDFYYFSLEKVKKTKKMLKTLRKCKKTFPIFVP